MNMDELSMRLSQHRLDVKSFLNDSRNLNDFVSSYEKAVIQHAGGKIFVPEPKPLKGYSFIKKPDHIVAFYRNKFFTDVGNLCMFPDVPHPVLVMMTIIEPHHFPIFCDEVAKKKNVLQGWYDKHGIVALLPDDYLYPEAESILKSFKDNHSVQPFGNMDVLKRYSHQ